MTEFALPSEQDATIDRLQLMRRSRFSFEIPQGDLKDSLIGMYSERVRDQMGHRALILCSEYQTFEYKPKSQDEAAAERLDSVLTKRIRTLKSKQYKPARWIEAERSAGMAATAFRLKIVLDNSTYEQLKVSGNDGLDQAKFGHKAMTAGVVVPDSDIIETPEARRAASRRLRDVLWADDAPDTPPNQALSATNQTSFVTGIDWSSERTRNRGLLQ